ncbi:MAG: tol-pal system protein YbgF [Desulfovibrio sp.]|jgi:tol-pal system protein YbgF|nr:tol-pal system protein YbgF [Desulfovibrio sp.]
MKKILLAPIAFVFLGGGCASTGQFQQVESASERNARILQETDHRLINLEQGVSGLNKQVKELDNRTYQVVTANGRKTGMKAVPAPASQPVPEKNSVARPDSAVKTPPVQPQFETAPTTTATAPILKPSVPPLPLPDDKKTASVKASRNGPETSTTDALPKQDKNPPVSGPQRVAGPSGSLGAAQPVPAAPSSGTAVAAKTPQRATPAAKTAPRQTVAANDAAPAVALPPTDFALPPEYASAPTAPKPAQAAPPPLTAEGRVPEAASAVPPAKQPVFSAISSAFPPAETPQNTQAAQPQSAPKQSAKPAQGEEAAYKEALKFAMSGRSNEGINQFRGFLQQYPNGRYAANAEYWIGECLYSQKNYKEALEQFQLVNTQYANHHKNADALLKAGMTLNKLGDRQGAAEKFRALKAQFPNSEAAGKVPNLGPAR